VVGDKPHRGLPLLDWMLKVSGLGLIAVRPLAALDLEAVATGIPAKFYGENGMAISAKYVDCCSASVNAI
jgi:hypothetical protein